MSSADAPIDLDDLVARFLPAARAQLRDVVATWTSAAELDARLERQLRLDGMRATDDQIASGFHSAMAIDGTTPDDFRWRLFDGPDLTALAGVGFERLDPSRPFVQVARATRALTPSDVGWLRDEVAATFANVGPRFVRIFDGASPGGASTDGASPDRWGASAERRLYAGPIGSVVQQTPSRPAPEVQLREAASLSFHERYEAVHEQLVRDRPELAGIAHAQSRDDLDASLAAGTLHEILVDGAWAGVTAALPWSTHGLDGYAIVEILLDAPYRGRHLGGEVLHQLATRLDHGDDAVLFATIGAADRPGRSVAEHAGQVDLGGWFDVAT